MTKKQRKQIARLWASGILYACGTDSFEIDVSINDSDAIAEEARLIAARLQGNDPYLPTLPEIIKYVLEPNKNHEKHI